MEFIVGKTYEIDHKRKGLFKITITETNEEFLSGVITEGTTKTMLAHNTRTAGDDISIRKSLIKTAKELNPA